jgi:hypothetical protein
VFWVLVLALHVLEELLLLRVPVKSTLAVGLCHAATTASY